jgi:hypothetical protein
VTIEQLEESISAAVDVVPIGRWGLGAGREEEAATLIIGAVFSSGHPPGVVLGLLRFRSLCETRGHSALPAPGHRGHLPDGLR